MMTSMKDRPSVSGTNRKWYIAVRANWSRESSTTAMFMAKDLAGIRQRPSYAALQRRGTMIQIKLRP